MWNTVMNNTTKLTLELRDIVDNGENSVDIWDFDYPSFYTGEDKKAFEKKVIDHYYFRQIGQETVGRWLHYFRTRIREIMPYYIQLYESVEVMKAIEDPFGNVDIVETFEEESTGTASGESSGSQNDTTTGTETTTRSDTKNGTENKEHRFSNTPQGSIDNLDNYMTEASKDASTAAETITGTGTGTSESTSKSSNTGSSTSTSAGTVKHTLTRKGNQGVNTYAHDMLELRQTFIDVDMMIINNLQDLFLGVY